MTFCMSNTNFLKVSKCFGFRANDKNHFFLTFPKTTSTSIVKIGEVRLSDEIGHYALSLTS